LSEEAWDVQRARRWFEILACDAQSVTFRIPAGPALTDLHNALVAADADTGSDLAPPLAALGQVLVAAIACSAPLRDDTLRQIAQQRSSEL
jgi:hypothetical protein